MIVTMMSAIQEQVLALIGSPWLYAVVFVVVLADAILVIVPSETVVVALGALALSSGKPELWILVPVAASGAVVGDNLCYFLGATIGTERYGWMRRRRVRAALDWARRALDSRAAALILTARYIPFGRIAANLAAGATRFSYRRFLPLTAVAGASWALYNVFIGALFGAWLGSNPVLAIIVSIGVAVSLGLVIDVLLARLARRREARTLEAEAVEAGTVENGRPQEADSIEPRGERAGRRSSPSTDSPDTASGVVSPHGREIASSRVRSACGVTAPGRTTREPPRGHSAAR